MKKQNSVEIAAISIISNLSKTFGNPEGWRSVLQDCAIQADVPNAMISARDKDNHFILEGEFWRSPFLYNYGEQVAKSYQSVAKDDCWVPLASMATPNTPVIASQTYSSKTSLPARFSKWLKFAEIDDTSISPLGVIGGNKLMLNFHFMSHNTNLDRLRHLLSLITKPIHTALLADSTAACCNSAKAVLEYAETFGKPVFLLERDGKMLDANPLAEKLLDTNCEFFRPISKEAFTYPIRDRKFVSLVNNTIDTGEVSLMRIDNNCSVSNLIAIITPTPCPKSFVGEQRTIVLVTIADMGALPADVSSLAESHELTTSEIKYLESLSQGKSYKEIAAYHNVEYDYIKETFSKIFPRLGVGKMGELIKFLGQLPRKTG